MKIFSLFKRIKNSVQTEQRLHETSVQLEKYKLVLDQSPVAMYIINNEMHFEYINHSFTRLFGYTKEDLLYKHVNDTIYKRWGKSPVSRNLIAGALLQGKTWEGQLLSIHKDGHRFWTSTIAFPVENEQGKVDGYIIIQQDITEQKQMELAIAESENLYRTLIEDSLDAVVLTQDFKFLYFNKIFCEMMGYTQEELLSVDPTTIIAPEEREKVMSYHEKRMSGEIFTQNYFTRFLRKDGTVFFAELKATSVQYKGKAASLITMRDVTERRQFEQALRESEEKYKALVENSQDSIMIIRENELLFANHAYCQMLGYDYKELLAMPSIEPIVPDDRYKALQIAERRKASDFSTIRDTIRIFTKNGEIRECECVATVIDYDGVPASFMTLHDVTESNRMQEALARSERRFRELADFMPQTLFELDKKMRLTYMNKSGMEIYGITENEYGIFSAQYFIPEDVDKLVSNLKTIVEGKSTELIYEYTAITKSGRKIPILTYSLPVYKHGEVVGVRGMVIDISERKAAEQALRESEEKYRTLVDNANDGIILTQDGRLKLVNKAMCDILQYQHEDFNDTPFYDYVVPEDRGEMERYHKRRMNGEQFNILYRSHLIRKDGKIITVELNARTLTYNGRPAAFIVVRDITERIAIENELKAAKAELEILNKNLESRVQDSSQKLAETHLQLINLQKENIQSQFDVLRQQVNPHFLFNSLNVLTSLIKIEPDLAEQFSEHLSKVYRYVLENKDNELVDLNTELRFLDAYIFLLNIRFVNKIKVNIHIPGEKLSALLIPLAMQLLIENAIKHNIMTKSNPLVIDIFIDENNYLNIVNNLQERPSQVVSTGIGLKNIENRYILLNNTRPIFEKTETQFLAKVPLVLK